MAPTTKLMIMLALTALLAPVRGAPASFQMQNGLDAQKLNAQFATLSTTDSCTGACVNCVPIFPPD